MIYRGLPHVLICLVFHLGMSQNVVYPFWNVDRNRWKMLYSLDLGLPYFRTNAFMYYISSYRYKYAVLQRPRKCECFMQYRCKTTICLINVEIASEHRNETCKHMRFFSLDIHVDQNKPAFEPSGISQIINLHKSRFHLTNQKKVPSFK